MSMLDQLIDMGFVKEKAEKALKATNELGLEEAINWLTDNETLLESGGGSTVELVEEEEKQSSTQAAKSLQCDECGKLLKDAASAEFHAAKSGHSQFSESIEEIQPMTEEQKREQVEALQKRLKEARAEKAEKEAIEAREAEKRRRAVGQDVALVRQRQQEAEMKKLADEKRRDKLEEKMAKQRVLDQIRQDREDRRGGETSTVKPETKPETITKPISTPPIVQSHYDQAVLQVRLTNGTVLKQSFAAKEPLSAVRLWVQMQRNDSQAPFGLMTAFPKKIFTEEDMAAPLESLGLVPTASLLLCRPVD